MIIIKKENFITSKQLTTRAIKPVKVIYLKTMFLLNNKSSPILFILIQLKLILINELNTIKILLCM